MRRLALGVLVGFLMGMIPAWGGGQTPRTSFGKYGTIAGQRAGSDNTIKGVRITGQSWVHLRTRTGDTHAYLTNEKFTVSTPLQVQAVTLYMDGEDLWAESQGERVKVVDFPTP